MMVYTTKAAIYKIYQDIQERKHYITAEKIKNVFLGIEQKHQTLLEILDYHNEERQCMIGVNVSQSVYNKYKRTRQQVADFLLYKYNLHDIPVKEIDNQFLCDFEAQHGYTRNTVVTALKKLRHIIEYK